MSESFYGSNEPVSVLDGLVKEPRVDMSQEHKSILGLVIIRSAMSMSLRKTSQSLVEFFMELTPHCIFIRTSSDRPICGSISVDYCKIKTEYHIEHNGKQLHKIELYTSKTCTALFTADYALAADWSNQLRKFSISNKFKEKFMEGHLIGQGNFGSVISAREKSSGEIYAVKKIASKKLTQDATEASFVLNEIQLLSKTNHKNCINLISVYEDDSCLYIVTNFFSGMDLLLTVLKSHHLPMQKALLYSQQLLQVLASLESQGIVHHDIKPQNLVLSDNSENAELCVVDFGFAVKVSNGELCSVQCGTRSYAAPEVLHGMPHSTKADVYSAGVMLCFMLTGELYKDILQNATDHDPDIHINCDQNTEKLFKEKYPGIPRIGRRS